MAFIKIDKAMKLYYDGQDRTDYMDANSKEGKFLQHCNDNGYEEDDIEEELDGDAEDCMYTDFDDNFPFREKVKHLGDFEKQKEIFNIIKHCFKYGVPPTKAPKRKGIKSAPLSIIVVDGYLREIINITNIPIIIRQLCSEYILKYGLTSPYDLKIDLKKWQIRETEKVLSSIFQYHSKLTNYKDYRALAIGYHYNRFPFLIFLMESYDRDRINLANQNKRDLKLKDWIEENNFFNKYLRFEKKDNDLITKIFESITFYIRKWMTPLKILPSILVMEKIYICDDIYVIVEYILSASKFVQNLIANCKYSTPFQIDFTIAVRDTNKQQSINNVNDDDSDNDDYIHYDRIGNFHLICKENKLLYNSNKILIKKAQKNNNILAKMLDTYNDFSKNVIVNWNTALDLAKRPSSFPDYKQYSELDNYGAFPDKRRFCCFIDRRRYWHKTRFEKRRRMFGGMGMMMMFGGMRGMGGMGDMGGSGPMYEWIRIHDRIDRNTAQDELIMYLPDKSFLPCNNGEKEKEILPESYFELLCTSMIPELRIEDDNKEEKHLVSERVTGISPADGSLFTISFQIERYDECRCYVWFNGQCIRLQVDDFWNILPRLFSQEGQYSKNQNFINDNSIKERIRKEFQTKDDYYSYFYKHISMIGQ